jgi:hypothetical protein
VHDRKSSVLHCGVGEKVEEKRIVYARAAEFEGGDRAGS